MYVQILPVSLINIALPASASLLIATEITCTINMKPQLIKVSSARNILIAIVHKEKAMASATALLAISARPNAHQTTNASTSMAVVTTMFAVKTEDVLLTHL